MMQVKSIYVHIFCAFMLLPGTVMSHPGHGRWSSGLLHQMLDHPLSVWVVVVILGSVLGSSIWVLRSKLRP